jgi:hypothetical protein
LHPDETAAMQRTLLIALCLCLLAWSLTGALSSARQGKPGLPGARAVIQAAEYPSLQAALDALPAEGGVVQIPPGVFEISAPLTLTRGEVLIQGAGSATHIKNISQTGASAITIRAPGYPQNKKARLWRVELAGLRITGQAQSGHGIEAHGVDELFVHGVTVSYHGGNGIHTFDCYEDPRIADCLISYNKKSGLYIEGGHDIVVCGNHFEENLDAVECIDAFNLCMSGNNLDDHLRHGVVIANTYGSVVASNMIEECKGTAVILDRDCYGITLSANVIAHHEGGGVDLRDAHGCAVSANTFVLVKQNALRIGPDADRITVTGNNFSDSYIGGAGLKKRALDDQTASGLVLDGTSDVTVSGNSFAGLTTKAVELLKPSRRVLFAGNVLTEVESDHERLAEGSKVVDNLGRE